MKRWIRRILMACSIALIVGASALWVRGYSKSEDLILGYVVIGNSRFFVAAGAISESEFRFRSYVYRPTFLLRRLLPQAIVDDGNIVAALLVPHWMLIVAGSVYPAFALLRRRRRKKDVGFPVEVGEDLAREGAKARRID